MKSLHSLETWRRGGARLISLTQRMVCFVCMAMRCWLHCHNTQARELADTVMSKSNNEDFIQAFMSLTPPPPPPSPSVAVNRVSAEEPAGDVAFAALSEEVVAAFYRDGTLRAYCCLSVIVARLKRDRT